MGQIKDEVKAYVLKYRCDTCGIGDMIATNTAYLSFTNKFKHYCNNCASETILDMKYPTTIFE